MSYIPQPFPFHTTLSDCLDKKHYFAGDYYRNIVRYTGTGITLPRFDILVSGTANSFNVLNAKTDAVVLTLPTATLITQNLSATKTSIVNIPGLITTSTAAIVEGTPYRFRVGIAGDSGTTFVYSEAFFFTQNVWCDNPVLLRWRDSTIIDETYHNATATQRFSAYLYTEPARPKYNVVVQNTPENSRGEVEASRISVVKEYEMELYAPEWIGDALAHTVLFDTVTLEFENGQIWSINPIRLEVDWDGYNGTFKFYFSRVSIVKMGCGEG